MIFFGLTGGIASGKSTVAQRFRERGVPVVDADQVARDVVAPGSDGLAAVVEAFGADVLTDEGALDRRKLAAIAFTDDAARRRLNAILHPRIGARTASLGADLAARGEPFACYEAALLIENGVADAFRPLVLVAAPEAAQIRRAVARDQLTEEAVEARLAAQMPLADKRRFADHIIENDGDLVQLRWRADAVLDVLRAGHPGGQP